MPREILNDRHLQQARKYAALGQYELAAWLAATACNGEQGRWLWCRNLQDRAQEQLEGTKQRVMSGAIGHPF
jgi:hypothetical protein